jgi:hypothetical protein
MRRSAARELRAAGVPESVIMKMANWKTRAMFERYNIVNDADVVAAIELREKARQTKSVPARGKQGPKWRFNRQRQDQLSDENG